MKRLAWGMLFLLFALPTFAQLPFPCSTTFSSAGPPILLNFNNGWRSSDGSIAYFSQFVCRDSGAVVMWTWQMLNCQGRCESAMLQQEADNMFPADVPHVCEGCLTMTSTAIPLSCPVTIDPAGLGRPPILEMYGTMGSLLDRSFATFSRFTCRDSGQVVMWTWQVNPATCNGPCEIAFGPGRDLENWPQSVPHICEGCLFARHRAVK